MPGIKPALDNGWQDVYTSPCSGTVRPGQYVMAALARAEFNGFAGYLTAHSRYKAGVYSDPAIWQQIFGTGKAGQIPHIIPSAWQSPHGTRRGSPAPPNARPHHLYAHGPRSSILTRKSRRDRRRFGGYA